MVFYSIIFLLITRLDSVIASKGLVPAWNLPEALG